MAKSKKIIVIVCLIFMVLLSIKIIKKEKSPLTEVSLNTSLSGDIILETEINEILGYIKFPKHNQKNPITLGTYEAVLDAGYVGLHLLSENIDKKPNNIILAAHNRSGLFKVLEKLQTNDLVEIHSLLNKYTFKVIEIEKIASNQMMTYIYKENIRILTLITCIENNSKRLVITLEEV